MLNFIQTDRDMSRLPPDIPAMQEYAQNWQYLNTYPVDSEIYEIAWDTICYLEDCFHFTPEVLHCIRQPDWAGSQNGTKL